MNLLVEDWGGKFQSHDISAKREQVKRIIRKYYLKRKFLDLKSNPDKAAQGTVVEGILR
jgi:translation initiation factor IF-2